jgi:hypothetical protein
VVGVVEGGDNGGEPSADPDDNGGLCRALTLAEVWSDPPAPWMVEALGEELARFTPSTWERLDALGAPPGGLCDIARRYGWRPDPDPDSDSDPQAAAALPVVSAEAAPVSQPLACEDPVDEPAVLPALGPPAPPTGLTMTAAWLCESLDNHLLCQEAAPRGMAAPAGQDWDGAAALAASQLAAAMRAMTAADWHSLDRFPERAGRVRVLTDRFGDSRREATAADQPRSARLGADPPFDTLVARLVEAGWEDVRRLAGNDVLVRRGPNRLLIRLVDLGQGGWTMPGGMLEPWVGPAGRTMPSPCRDLWQDIAMMRALDAQQAATQGLVVIGRGGFADDAGTVRGAGSGRRRSGIALVCLDTPKGGLPDLSVWLDGMGRGAGEDAVATARHPQR